MTDVPETSTELRPAEPADPRVAIAVAGLNGVGERPLAEQAAVFEAVHRQLEESLAEAAEVQDGAGSASS